MKEFPLRSDVAAAVAAAAQIKESLAGALTMFSDTSIPVKERWANYVALQEAGLLKTRLYGDGLVEELVANATLYDDFHVDRHQTCTYREMYDLRDHPKRANWKWDEWREKVLKNEVSKGYGSFTYDW